MPFVHSMENLKFMLISLCPSRSLPLKRSDTCIERKSEWEKKYREKWDRQRTHTHTLDLQEIRKETKQKRTELNSLTK